MRMRRQQTKIHVLVQALTEILDHEAYNVKCCVFESNGEQGCIFSLQSGSGRRVDVLKVYNSALLSQNLHKIAWKMQRHEGILTFFVSEAAFIGENPMSITSPVNRLILFSEKSHSNTT